MQERRSLLAAGLLAASAFALPEPANAAYGEGANVFGRVTNRTGFIPYAGENFALLVPSKWNPSNEREDANIVVRYADNFDQTNHLFVTIKPTNKTSVSDLGSPEQFAQLIKPFLGVQSWVGETVSEGGFAPGETATAALLSAEQESYRGKSYYKLEVLTRSADGDEGGRHQLFKATVSDGKLYILKVQAGDKRWFKGVDKQCLGVLDSFTVA